MEYSQDYIEIKKQIFDLLELSNKTIETKTIRIHRELASLQKENQIISNKVREYIDKMELLSFSTSNTLVNEVSTQLGTSNNSNNNNGQKRKASTKSDGKINIQNLVINKKVQIGKHFSKLNINNISTSPSKQMDYHLTEQNAFNGNIKNITNFNPKKNTSIIKMKIYSKDKSKQGDKGDKGDNVIPHTPKKSNKNVNENVRSIQLQRNKAQSRDKESNRTSTTVVTGQGMNKRKNQDVCIGLKASKSITDLRKFSIMDIQSASLKENNNSSVKNKKTMRNYLYDKNHKFYYVMAKQNIIPLKLRLIFGGKVSNFYSKQDIYSDYNNFIESKYNELLNMKKEYKQFVLSITSQVAFNIITSIDEKNCLDLLNPSSEAAVNTEKLNSFYDLLIVFYYLLNEPIDDSLPKESYSLFNDLLTSVLPKQDNTSLKTCHLEIMTKGIKLSHEQLSLIEDIYYKVVKTAHFKPFDKISSAFLFLLEDIHDYSLILMSNGSQMINYPNSITYCEEQKEYLQQNHY